MYMFSSSLQSIKITRGSYKLLLYIKMIIISTLGSQLGSWLKGVVVERLMSGARVARKVAKEDPRRITHSVKMGAALAFTSLFYYLPPVYNSYGAYGLWSLITVVFVLDFSVGATIGKCLFRVLATIIGGALAVGAHFLATISGHVGHPLLIAIFVFLQGSVSTYLRFFPNFKGVYEYGLIIFILTFSMVSASGFHSDEVIDIALKRLSTILIGIAISLATSIFFFPVWAGQDLHNLLILNMEKLATLLQYLPAHDHNESNYSTSIINIINSITKVEALANFARWEPAHGKFMFSHPWNTYVRLGNLTRECAYQIEAALIKNNTHETVDEATVVGRVEETCRELSVECSKAISALSLSMKTMAQPSLAESHVAISRNIAQKLQSLLKETDDNDIISVLPLLETMSIVNTASCLLHIVTHTEKMVELVHELARTKLIVEEPVVPVSSSVCPCTSTVIEEEGGKIITVVDEDSSVEDGKIIAVVDEPSSVEGGKIINVVDQASSVKLPNLSHLVIIV